MGEGCSRSAFALIVCRFPIWAQPPLFTPFEPERDVAEWVLRHGDLLDLQHVTGHQVGSDPRWRTTGGTTLAVRYTAPAGARRRRAWDSRQPPARWSSRSATRPTAS